ncbi:MAG: right-handed parallel beta-helix repeat-containing protein, partial [Desulfobacterales bacterium]|nr:right-handed parallel beta-helix repeat-containing protein [Desulfobacterales bacterium]
MKFLRMTAILFVLLLAWVGQATAYTNVSGDITQDTTWTKANSPYFLIGQVTVVSTRTLTIEAGVVVKSSAYGLSVDGKLIADGTSGEPIVFTSFKDDTAGGDTNADGGATTPARGDWGNLRFSLTSAGNVLDYVKIRYGGGSGSHSLIVLNSLLTLSNSTVEESGNDGIYAEASPTITGSVIRNNNGHGIRVYSSNATITNNTISGNGTDGIWAGDSSAATITGNTITGNSSYPIYLEASALNSIISGNIFFGNGLNGIAVIGEISAPTTWGSLDAPYVVAAGQVT